MANPTTITVSLVGEDPQLASEVADAAESRGAPLSLGDLYDVMKAAERKFCATLDRPYGTDRSGALPRTVEVGPVTLRTVTVAGSIALRKLISWQEYLDQTAFDVLEAWIYAHSWDLDQIARLVDLDSANAIVAEWSAQLIVSPAELLEGIRKLTSHAYPETDGVNSPASDPIAALDGILKRYVGSPVDLLKTPLPLVAHLMDAAGEAERTTAAKQARAAGKQPPLEVDPNARAEGVYQDAKTKLGTPPPDSCPPSPSPHSES